MNDTAGHAESRDYRDVLSRHVRCVTVPAGLVAVCDNRSLDEPDASLPATHVTRSPAGFVHWYSRPLTGDLRDSRGGIAPGVDIITAGCVPAGEEVSNRPVVPLPPLVFAAALRLEQHENDSLELVVAEMQRIRRTLHDHLGDVVEGTHRIAAALEADS